MGWREWLYVGTTLLMMASLYGMFFYLWGDKARRERVERAKHLIFTDEPLDPRGPAPTRTVK